MEYREGQFIRTFEDLIFEIKGIVHPENRVIAYLRYIPDMKGRRKHSGSVSYSKIYDLLQREQFLKKLFPEYLFYDPINGRIMQSVPKNRIKQIMDPVEHLKELRSTNKADSKLEKIAVEFARNIVINSGISWESIGITGSILAGLSLPTSDIDLVVYGKTQVQQVYDTIINKKDRIGIQSYQGNKLRDHVKTRWGIRPREITEALIQIESLKAFQGTYKDVDFFIRGVIQSYETNERYGDIITERDSHIRTKCRIIGADYSLYTPCKYQVICSEWKSIREVISFRGRFTEQAKEGDEVLIEGTIEHVKNSAGEKLYDRIILGENYQDLLLPLKFLSKKTLYDL
ncbi:MAG: nucleotidyltransferase domain-containing protein [Candidatus Thorarchaeota archaeon]